MGGEVRRPPHAGHVDLSMTRHVLEGLAADRWRDDLAHPACGGPVPRALPERRRRLFSLPPVVVDANKAGRDGKRPKSYGTATADGLLALLALGVAADDPRVVGARDWLVRHHRIDRVPEIAATEPGEWETAMIFYYRAASARAFAELGVEEAPLGIDWREETAAALFRVQRPDGSFANDSFLMKEDDPLIATTLAVQALLATGKFSADS